jgi:hypothetical protein
LGKQRASIALTVANFSTDVQYTLGLQNNSARGLRMAGRLAWRIGVELRRLAAVEHAVVAYDTDAAVAK